jgi:hypothetical protein
MGMGGKRGAGKQGVTVEDAIDFLREGALVREISGKPALTSKGERLLYELQESSSSSPPGSGQPDGSSLSEGAANK